MSAALTGSGHASASAETTELIVIKDAVRAPIRYDTDTDEEKNAQIVARAKALKVAGIPARLQDSDAPQNGNAARPVVNQGRAWRNVGISGIVIGSTVTALFLVTILAITVPSFNNLVAKSSSTGLKITEVLAKHNALGVAVGGLAVGFLITSGGTISMIWYRKGIAKMNEEKEALARVEQDAKKALENLEHQKKIGNSQETTLEIEKISENIKGLLDDLRNIKQKIYAFLEKYCDEIESVDPSITETMKIADIAQLQRLLDNLDNCNRLATDYKLAPQPDTVRLPGTTARALQENETLRVDFNEVVTENEALRKAKEGLENSNGELTRRNEQFANASAAHEQASAALKTIIGGLEKTNGDLAQANANTEAREKAIIEAKAAKAALKSEVSQKERELVGLENAFAQARVKLEQDEKGSYDSLPADHQLRKDKAKIDELAAAQTVLNRRLVEAKERVIQAHQASVAAIAAKKS